MLPGGEILYKKLCEHSVKHVFMYSGGAIMKAIDYFHHSRQNKIKYYINTHEQNCGHSATSYAKTSEKPGIAIVTSGPGLTNMITPLLDAKNDSTPLILFSGQVTTNTMGTNAFQECDAVELSTAATKWSYCVKDVNELPSIIDKAFYVAMEGKKGSVHIDLPKDVLMNKANYKNKKTITIQDEVDIDKIKQAATIINNSKKPIFYVGQGCNDYSSTLSYMISKVQIPITTTIHAMGVYDETNSFALKFVGMHGSVAANKLIQESDCIIAIGCRFDDRTTGNVEKYAPVAIEAGKQGTGGIIHCNIEKNEINKVIKTNYNFNMDSGMFMKSIIPWLIYKERTQWLNKIKCLKEKYPFTYIESENLKTQDVLCEFNRRFSTKHPDLIVTSGVGNHQMMSSQFITWRFPKTFISSGSLGVMGVGLPYAIGAQIANPEKTVIDIDGDSSFNHTLSDLKTIVEYNLPIKIAIMNNRSQDMVRVWEELFFEGRHTATSCEKNPEYHLLAESYGIKGIECKDKKELSNKIDFFMNYKGPILCNFKVETDRCLPLVPPGNALDEMLLNDNDIKKLKNTSSISPPS